MRHRIVLNAESINLTRQETDFLDTLIRVSPRTATFDYIIEALWLRDEPTFPKTSISVLVHKLRRKIGAHARIVSVREVGFRFVLGAK